MLSQFKKDLIELPSTEREEILKISPLRKETISMPSLLSHLGEGDVVIDSEAVWRETYKDTPERQTQVIQVLIKESIWDHLCNTPRYDCDPLLPRKIMDFDSWAPSTLERDKYNKSRLKLPVELAFKFYRGMSPIHQLDAVQPEEMIPLLRKLIELLIVGEHLLQLRKNWAPTTGTGSQSTNLEDHINFHTLCIQIAAQEEIESLTNNLKYEDDEKEKTLLLKQIKKLQKLIRKDAKKR